MIYKNIQKYAQENWSGYKKEISECSKNSKDGRVIIECDKKIYCFDDICKNIFHENKLPTSVDGIDFKEKEIHFIEYKTGFKDRITRDNYRKSEKSICDYSKDACEDYWGLFFAKRDKEKEELLLNIKMKALETFLIFDKEIIPLCDDLDDGPVKARLIVVADVDPVDYCEDTLGELSGKKPTENNWISRIKNSLVRCYTKQDALGNDYLYDRIDVYSIQEYQRYISA